MSEDYLNLLDAAKTRFIRILRCDNGGVIRGKAVQRSRLSAHVKHGVGISEAQQAFPATVDAPAPGSGLGPVGEVRLVPDFNMLSFPPYAPGHARVIGDMRGCRPAVSKAQACPSCHKDWNRPLIIEARCSGG